MTDEEKQFLFDHYLKPEHGDHMTFRVQRGEVQQGRTFSAEALDEMHEQIGMFIGARILNRWQTTTEPPTIVTVKVDVIVG